MLGSIHIRQSYPAKQNSIRLWNDSRYQSGEAIPLGSPCSSPSRMFNRKKHLILSEGEYQHVYMRQMWIWNGNKEEDVQGSPLYFLGYPVFILAQISLRNEVAREIRLRVEHHFGRRFCFKWREITIKMGFQLDSLRQQFSRLIQLKSELERKIRNWNELEALEGKTAN